MAHFGSGDPKGSTSRLHIRSIISPSPALVFWTVLPEHCHHIINPQSEVKSGWYQMRHFLTYRRASARCTMVWNSSLRDEVTEPDLEQRTDKKMLWMLRKGYYKIFNYPIIRFFSSYLRHNATVFAVLFLLKLKQLGEKKNPLKNWNSLEVLH